MFTLPKEFHQRIGVLGMALASLWFVYVLFTGIFSLGILDGGIWSVSFLIILVVVMLLPGAIVAFSSYWFYREPSLENIKWMLGPTVLVCIFIILSEVFDNVLDGGAGAEKSMWPYEWIVIVVSIPIYAWLSKMIIWKYFRRKIHVSYLFGKTTSCFTAFGVWTSSNNLLMWLDKLLPAPFNLLTFILWFALPFMIYKSLVEWIYKARDRNPLDQEVTQIT